MYRRWNNLLEVTGDIIPKKPPLIAFNMIEKAITMVKLHIDKGSKIIVHCDVDVDGLSCGLIWKKFLVANGVRDKVFIINKKKKHGITQEQVEKINQLGDNVFLVIVDSSSGKLDEIKQLNCDTLVIDHHKFEHSELYGKRQNGSEFVIISNMIDGRDGELQQLGVEKYTVDSAMSCALVCYEFMRVYQEYFKTNNYIESLKLYQWAALSLYTDSICTLNKRNQWYIYNTVIECSVVESTLSTFIHAIDKWAKGKLSKNFIVWKLAPLLSSAIRAGATEEVLDIVINRPEDVLHLEKYKQKQKVCIEEGVKDVMLFDTYVLRDLTNNEVEPSYCGVIAGKLADSYKRNAIVFQYGEDGYLHGSFRGRMKGVRYLTQFKKQNGVIMAEGHEPAFGFTVVNDWGVVQGVMSSLVQVEDDTPLEKHYLTAGDILPEERGEFHITDMEAFKREGNVFRLAMGNTKVLNNDEIGVIMPHKDVMFSHNRGKLLLYRAIGLECKAFEEITTPLVRLDLDYVGGDVVAFVRNVESQQHLK